MNKAGGGLTYKLRVVPPHVTISRQVTATEYNVRGLRTNTRYTVYVSAVSLGLYGPEVSTTVGSESLKDFICFVISDCSEYYTFNR